ncbi:MAG: MFS transporter, partial [Acidimicrobiia bacterium]|nr:MFS transporter [Acidimicrobiia bacterium]
LYLLLTLAPFAVVAPLIGPAIDRAQQGSRWVILGSCGARAVAAFLMVAHLDSLLLFPEAFAMLVLGKGYSVAKSAYLPATVASDDDLVAANSKLAIVSPLAAALVAAPAGLASVLGGSQWAMGFAGLVFVAATALALRLPGRAAGAAAEGAAVTPATATADRAAPAGGESRRFRLVGERPVLPAGVLLGASAMGLLRGSVGFLTFLIAFDLRTSGASAAGYGLVLGAVGAGSIGGALLAPQLRRHVREERLLAAALIVTTAASFVAALLGGLVGALLVITAVGVAAATAKLAFDAVVQRDCGENKGRAFASFESRFQVLWVVGALLGLASIPTRVGFLLLGVLAAATAVAFIMGRNIVEVARDLVTVPEDVPDDAPAVRSGAEQGPRRGADPEAPTLADVVDVLTNRLPEEPPQPAPGPSGGAAPGPA